MKQRDVQLVPASRARKERAWLMDRNDRLPQFGHLVGASSPGVGRGSRSASRTSPGFTMQNADPPPQRYWPWPERAVTYEQFHPDTRLLFGARRAGTGPNS